jgi:hypothetical protein
MGQLHGLGIFTLPEKASTYDQITGQPQDCSVHNNRKPYSPSRGWTLVVMLSIASTGPRHKTETEPVTKHTKF